MIDRDQLEQAILSLENQRAVLGDDVVDAAMESMQDKLTTLIEAQNATQQRKLATVLFMDIVDSTQSSLHQRPQGRSATDFGPYEWSKPHRPATVNS